MTNELDHNYAGPESRKWVTEGFLLAGFTAYAYAITFTFETGYSSYYQIPWQFITITPTTMLIASGSILAVTLVFYSVLNLIWFFIPRSESLISFTIRRAIGKIVWVIICFLPVITKRVGMVGLPVVILFILFGEFVWPLITQRTERGYVNKLQAQDTLEDKYSERTLMYGIVRRLGPVPIVLVFIVAGGLFIAYFSGQHVASMKRNYLIVPGKEGGVVVAIYGDYMISRKLDKKEHTIYGPVEVANLSRRKNVLIKRETVGPLGVRGLGAGR